MSRIQWEIRFFGLVCAAAVLVSTARAADTQDGFAFNIPKTGVKPGTAPALVSPDNPGIADGDVVELRGSRFGLSGGERTVRFWGTNLCFQGCFPPHEVAVRMARRMGSLGINCVRFHHMDRAAYPRGLWKASREGAWAGFEHEEFHPEALDRLDYLVAQLKKQGIYVNFNLHVSRGFGEADGFPAVGPDESVPKFGKGVTQF